MAKSKKDISKLPEWVQVKLSKLEADVTHWKEKALPVMGKTSRLVLQGGFLEKDIYLPEDSRLRFNLGGSKFLEFHLKEKGVGVYGDWAIIFQCCSSNVALLSTKRMGE